MPKNQLYHLPEKNNDSMVIWIIATIIGFCVIIIFSGISTQYLAYSFNYDQNLPGILKTSENYKIYNPFAWIIWCQKLPNLRHKFVIAYIITAIGILTGLMLALFIIRNKSKKEKPGYDFHGSARWATKKEIVETGLFNSTNEGVYLGAWYDPKAKDILYLRHNGPEHILAFAPTRSGKGVGLVIPTLLSWTGSVVIHDIKGENWFLTSGWRKEELGTMCLKFDPADSIGGSVKFNPLEEIRLGSKHEVKDAQNIAAIIVDPDGKGLNDHWAKTGFSLLVGTILHVLYAEKDKTLHGVISYLSDPNFRLIEQMFFNMIETIHDQENKFNWRDTKGCPTRTHPVVAACARDMLNKSDNERSGVLSTALSFLNIYRDPIVAKNTSKSEFKIRDLMNHEKSISLYIIAPPSDKDRLKPLFRLLLNQIVRTLTEIMDFTTGIGVPSYKHRLLLMIDEFPALGKLDIFAESLSFIAGYGIKAYLISQDLIQLYGAYGKEESIVSNCHIRIAFAPNKMETAELLSSMIGSMTITVKNKSYSGNRMSMLLTHTVNSETDQKRPLLTPDEVMRLPADDALIFVAGHRPIYGKKIKYYHDAIFADRAQIKAPINSDIVSGINKTIDHFYPTHNDLDLIKENNNLDIRVNITNPNHEGGLTEEKITSEGNEDNEEETSTDNLKNNILLDLF